MFVVVDASVWVSRLVPEDEFHERVKAWLANQRERGMEFVSPSLLLAEVGGAISRRTGSPELAGKAIRQLENLPGLRLVEMDHTLSREAADLAAELGLRGADAIYVAVAARLSLPLVTLDADQRSRAAKRVDFLSL